MRIRTRIAQVARARGMTAAEVARRLGLYRSNLSAMDGGDRFPSLEMLARLCEALHCAPGDLLEPVSGGEKPVFRRPDLDRRLRERDQNAPGGSQKGWVHAAFLAWQRHYRRGRAFR